MRLIVVAIITWVGLSASCTAQEPIREKVAEYWAFTAPWDPASAASVTRNSGRLGAVVTGWIALDSASGRPFVAATYKDTQQLARGVRRLAIVTSWHNDRFHTRS